MKRFAIAVVTATSLALAWNPVGAESQAMFDSQSLTPEIALEAANEALKKCRDEGYQVAVAVVDRAGILQALVRDRYAGPHTVDTSRRKAWTAASFRGDTSELVAFLADNPQQAGVRQISGALMLGGGKIIEASGSLVGAIGVSGAPNAAADDACANAGIEAIKLDIEF